MRKATWFLVEMTVFAALATVAPAQTLTTLFSFDALDGSTPEFNSLVQGLDGNFYGTAYGGGVGAVSGDLCNVPGCGTAFRMTPEGTLTTLYNFCSQENCIDGAGPIAGLVLATSGDFYGTTLIGGSNCVGSSGCGTVFKITSDGTLTTLYSFCSQPGCADGEMPFAALIQATDGNFYGTTPAGGASGLGTVFKITSTGTLTTLHSFCSQGTYPNCPDGALPYAGLVQAADGNFYGTTSGGESGGGTVFKITPAGTLTTLHSFCSQGTYPDCPDGAQPDAALLQASPSGNFYGTTTTGGDLTCNSPNGCGTVFKITPTGALTTLHRFCSQGAYPNCPDGAQPEAGLLQGTDGNFYGATAGSPGGTVFRITDQGDLTTLYSFCSQAGCMDGLFPWATLLQSTNGNFYGTTMGGGDFPNYCNAGCGTVFSLSAGLGPFVKTLPAAGKAGETVRILGTDLSETTHVRFDHMEAAFQVISESEIQTRVPDGATTGFVTVTLTRRGPRLKSNVPFHVLP